MDSIGIINWPKNTMWTFHINSKLFKQIKDSMGKNYKNVILAVYFSMSIETLVS